MTGGKIRVLVWDWSAFLPVGHLTLLISSSSLSSEGHCHLGNRLPSSCRWQVKKQQWFCSPGIMLQTEARSAHSSFYSASFPALRSTNTLRYNQENSGRRSGYYMTEICRTAISVTQSPTLRNTDTKPPYNMVQLRILWRKSRATVSSHSLTGIIFEIYHISPKWIFIWDLTGHG